MEDMAGVAESVIGDELSRPVSPGAKVYWAGDKVTATFRDSTTIRVTAPLVVRGTVTRQDLVADLGFGCSPTGYLAVTGVAIGNNAPAPAVSTFLAERITGQLKLALSDLVKKVGTSQVPFCGTPKVTSSGVQF